MADLERTLQPIIKKASKGFRVILLNGQRQVGKTTLLKNLAGETGGGPSNHCTKRRFVSLDDMNARKLAKTDPELFIAQLHVDAVVSFDSVDVNNMLKNSNLQVHPHILLSFLLSSVYGNHQKHTLATIIPTYM